MPYRVRQVNVNMQSFPEWNIFQLNMTFTKHLHAEKDVKTFSYNQLHPSSGKFVYLFTYLFNYFSILLSVILAIVYFIVDIIVVHNPKASSIKEGVDQT